MVDCFSISMDLSMDLIDEFVAFEFYRIPPDPERCIVEEGG